MIECFPTTSKLPCTGSLRNHLTMPSNMRRPATVTLSLTSTSDETVLTISDDGQGFDPRAVSRDDLAWK